MADLSRYTDSHRDEVTITVRDFFNHHRELLGRNDLMDLTQAGRILDGWLKQPNDEVLVYIVNGQSVGFARLRESGGVYWLEDFGVTGGRRGKGYGRAMLEAIGDYLQERGQNSIYAPVTPLNVRAIEFYVRCGFTSLNMIELRKDLEENTCREELARCGDNFELRWSANPSAED